MDKYIVQSGFLVLDNNINVIDWYDTEEEAEALSEELNNEE